MEEPVARLRRWSSVQRAAEPCTGRHTPHWCSKIELLLSLRLVSVPLQIVHPQVKERMSVADKNHGSLLHSAIGSGRSAVFRTVLDAVKRRLSPEEVP